MQICVARMLKESGIFFAVRAIPSIFCGNKRGSKFGVFQLLSVLAIGFGQGLYALDAADGSTDGPSTVNNRVTILPFLKTKIRFVQY
jgi:hypothetical protein